MRRRYATTCYVATALSVRLMCCAVVLASALALPPVGAILLLSAAGCLTYCWYGLLSFQAIRERERKVLAAGRS